LEPEIRSPYALAGAAAHHLLNQWAKDTCFSIQDDLPDLWDAAWQYVVDHPHNPKEEGIPINWFPNEQIQYSDLKTDYLAMLGGWLAGQPECKVLASELDFTLELGKYIFAGTLDRIYQTPQGRMVLADFKTGKQIPSDDLIVEAYQFAIYCLAAEQMGYPLDAFAWIHLRDFIPYERDTSFDRNGRQRNVEKAAWLERVGVPVVNKTTGEINGKLKISAGQPRGPGIYEFSISPEWRRSRKQLLLWAAGALALSNPIPIINENCEFCELRRTCRDKIYGRVLAPTTALKPFLEEV
jgi:hypothetical protein